MIIPIVGGKPAATRRGYISAVQTHLSGLWVGAGGLGREQPKDLDAAGRVAVGEP